MYVRPVWLRGRSNLLTTFCVPCSGLDVLPVAESDFAHADGRASRITRCCAFIIRLGTYCSCSRRLLQVFYGRYLKKLSNRTQEALGDMTKVCLFPQRQTPSAHLIWAQVAQETLSALRTVQAFNAQAPEQAKFDKKVDSVLALAVKEARASAIFFGTTGLSGNVTILALLGYGASAAR
jgi:ABC-type multidrug transport system fused ATPase/permease subunit